MKQKIHGKKRATGKAQKVRRISLGVKVLVPVAIVIFAVCTVMSFYSVRTLREETLVLAQAQAQAIAEITVDDLSGSVIEKLQPGDEGSEDYEYQMNKMIAMQVMGGIKNSYSLYADEDGKMYYGIDSDLDEPYPIGAEFELTQEDLQMVYKGQVYVVPEIYEEDGLSLITVYAPIKNDKNGLIVGVLGCDYDATKIVEQVQAAVYRLFTISAIGILVSLSVLLISVFNIIRGLRSVNGKVYDLVNNEGDLTQQLKIRTGDELELIAGNVNALLEYIRGIMINISENSGKLNDSSKSIVTDITDTKDALLDVSATMEQMSAGMQETSASIIEISSAIADIVDEIDNVNERAGEGRASSGEIMAQAAAVYQNAVDEKENAKVLVNQLSASMNDKIEKSKAVETITALTDNIISITSQTNLLSLNASIEAARAGEAGRGFAVVADEIGKLAANSADAAAQIQVVSADVIQAVNDLAQEADKMVRFIDETAMGGYEKLLDTSRDYEANVDNMNKLMVSFADISVLLKKSVDSIQDAVSSVNIAVEESARGIVNVSEATVKVSASMDDIGEEADINLGVANDLDREVNRFKLY